DTTADADANLALSAPTVDVNEIGRASSRARMDSEVQSGTVTHDDGHGNLATASFTAADVTAGAVTLGHAAFSGLAGLVDGSITVSATVTDDAGNHASPASTASFTLDTTADADANLALSAPTVDVN